MKTTLLSATRLAALSLAFLASAALTGCGIGVSAPAGSGLVTEQATLKGNVHGGQQPVIHSAVSIYSAGTTGYGSAATKLATVTSNDIDGSFSFTKLATTGSSSGTSSTWQCPNPATAGDPMIYMTAIGGNPNGGTDHTINNSAIGMVTVLGPCSTVNGGAFVSINEITTAAAAITFGPYFNPNTESIGTNGVNLAVSGVVPQGAVGLNNAFVTFLNLVNPSDGTAIPAFARIGTGTAAGVTLTGTNESDKLITFANILSGCINSGNVDAAGSNPAVSSAQCTQMFASAVPPALPSATSVAPTSFSAATDTLMSAIYMAINPADAGTFTASSCGTATSHLQCLYNLQTAFPAFGGGLSAMPTDWTLSTNYTASGPCTNGKLFILGPDQAAIDAAGNFWFINGAGASGAANFGEISPNGTPLVCTGAGTAGRGITIDPTGNVWAAFNSNTTNGIKEWPVGGSAVINWATPETPWAVVSDKDGNIFVESTGSGGDVYEFLTPGNASSAFASTKIITQVDANVNSAFAYSTATDSLGRLYFPPTDGSNYQVYQTAAPVNAAITGYSVSGGVVTFTATNSFATNAVVNVTGLAAGAAFNHQLFTVTSSDGNTFTAATTAADTTQTTDSGTASTLATYASFKFSGTGTHYGVAVDSNNNVFDAFTSSSAFVRKYAANANAVAATATTSANWIGGVNGARGMTLDGAANIWVATFAPQSGSASTPPTGNFAAVEIATTGSSAFTAVSPTGVTAAPSPCSSSGCATLGGYQKASLVQGYGVAVDISGNVWYPGSNLPGAYTNGFAGTNVVEILGAAVPIATPLSVAAKNGTLATRP